MNCSCQGGRKLISGGCNNSGEPFVFQTSIAINNETWSCGGHGGQKQVRIFCCNIN